MTKIKLYGAPWCYPCGSLKAQMDKEKLSYEFCNVDYPEHALTMALLGVRSIPFVTVDEIFINDPSVKKIKEAVGVKKNGK